jgi:Bicoid-interacting protein 3 (Bin3)
MGPARHAGVLVRLQLRPEGFVDYLTEQQGFFFVRQLEVLPSTNGFDRPLFLFQKR